MSEYRGFVQSVIRRGWDSYQVTLGIYMENGAGKTEEAAGYAAGDKLLVFRADIAIDDNRTILFPDRDLAKCIDAFFGAVDSPDPAEGLRRKTVGKIAAEICGKLSDQILYRKMAKAV